MIKNSLKYLFLALLFSTGLMAQVQVGQPILGAASGDYFGENTAINGNGTIVAGFATMHDSNKGHVRVFQYTPTGNASWTQMGSDIDGESANDNGAIENGGNNIALNLAGNILAFGSVNDDGTATNAGHVRVFQFISGNWVQMGDDIDGEAQSDNLGVSVALSDDGYTIVIGANEHDDDGASQTGAIYVYTWNGSAWVQKGSSLHGSANHLFGNDVSVNSNGTIIAGSSRRASSNKGQVKIYQYNSSATDSWTLIGSILGEANNDYSGASISLNSSGNIIAIGATNNTGANGSQSGHVRVYKYSPTGNASWTQLGADIDGESASDYFGDAVSLSGDGFTLAVGARQNEGGGSTRGGVYIYKFTPTETTSWTQFRTDIDGGTSNNAFWGESVSISKDGTRVVGGSCLADDGPGSNAGLLKVFDFLPEVDIFPEAARYIEDSNSEQYYGAIMPSSGQVTFTAIFSEPINAITPPTITIGNGVTSATMTAITSQTFMAFAQSGVASYVSTDNSSMTFWTYNVNGTTQNYSTSFTDNAVWVYSLNMDNWSGSASGTFTAIVSATDFGGYLTTATTTYTFENIMIDTTTPTVILSDNLKEEKILDIGWNSTTSTGGDGAWQEFTPTKSGYVYSIYLKQGNPTNFGYGFDRSKNNPARDFGFEMKIYSGVTGNNGSSLSGGTLIGTTKGYIPRNQTTAGGVAYVFETPVSVTGGTKYWFQIKALDSSISTYSNTYMVAPDTYANNAGLIGGSSKDLAFQVWMKNTLSKNIGLSSTVTLVANFSKSMANSPTITIGNGVSNAYMTASSSSTWKYVLDMTSWSGSGTSAKATVNGKDYFGNTISGNSSITFNIDTTTPTVTLTSTDADNRLGISDTVTFTATFSESMLDSPTITIGDGVVNKTMTVSSSSGVTSTVWTYFLNMSTWSGSQSDTFKVTVAGKDLSENPYSGSDSITISIDTVAPTVMLNDTDADNIIGSSGSVTITAFFSEQLTANPIINLSGIGSATMTPLTGTTTSGITITGSSLWNSGEPNNSNSGTEKYGMIQDNGGWGLNDSTPSHQTVHVLEINSTDIKSISGYNFLGTFNGHNYFQSTGRATWENSKTQAVSKGGYLSVINSTAEFNFLVAQTFSNVNIGIWIGLYQDTNDPNYSEPSGGWKWINQNYYAYKYILTSSNSVATTTATVSGTDSNGNAYSGSESITFNFDYTNPQVTQNGISADNLTVSLTFNEAVYTELISGQGSNSLSTSDFQISLSGNSSVTLGSSSPTSVTRISGTNIYSLTISLTGFASGQETLTITIPSNSIYDIAGNSPSTVINISLKNNLLVYYDFSNPNSYNGLATSNSNNTVEDLSGNNYDGIIKETDRVYYDSYQDAIYFNGSEQENAGIAIKTLNYVNNNSDQLNELSIVARVKLKTGELNRGNDQRILFTMDRSENFRFSVGSDYNTDAKGKLAFHFNVNGTVFDTHAVSQTLDLRDEKWHTVGVTFKANVPGGLKYYVDGILVYQHPGNFGPIGSENGGPGPRYGWVGNGSESASEGNNTGPNHLFYGYMQAVKYYNKQLSVNQLNIPETSPPNVILTDTESDNIIKGSDTVTITATFNEAMSSSPTINISNQVTNAAMTVSSTNNIWYYNWSVTSQYSGLATATVSGTDLSGNAYAGTESITFSVDNTGPSVGLTHTHPDQIVSDLDNLALTATFNESLSSTPTIFITGLMSETFMSSTNSSTVWTYYWNVPGVASVTTGDFSLSVSATDIAGNLATMTNSVTFTIDNVKPKFSSAAINTNQDEITLSFTENVYTNQRSASNLKSSGALVVGDFVYSISGGTATLSSTTPSSIQINSASSVSLGVQLNGIPDGNEIITIDAATSESIHDIVGNSMSGAAGYLIGPNKGWTASQGSFQNFSGSSGNKPYIAENNLIFAYTDNVSVYKTFDIPIGVTTITLSVDYFKNYSADTGKVVVKWYNGNNYTNYTSNSGTLTADNTNGKNFTQSWAIPMASDVNNRKVRVELHQINEAEYWAGNYGMKYRNLKIYGVDGGSDTGQISNSVKLTNVKPNIVSTTITSDNSSVTIIFSENVTAPVGQSAIDAGDFELSISGGSATLSSTTPSSFTATNSKTYVLGLPLSSAANGSEILTVKTLSNSVIDSSEQQVDYSLAQSNTIQLNDKAGPVIIESVLQKRNKYIDLTFNEGVYADTSSSTGLSTSTLSLTQTNGADIGLSIIGVKTANNEELNNAGRLSGGETKIRVFLTSTNSPTGNEVYTVSAYNSSSIYDALGNNMLTNQTNNTFKLNPPVSGPPSLLLSTIEADPETIVVKSERLTSVNNTTSSDISGTTVSSPTVNILREEVTGPDLSKIGSEFQSVETNNARASTIIIQAVDSLGQKFNQGGASVKVFYFLFGNRVTLDTKDNNDGTYTVEFNPGMIGENKDFTLGFSLYEKEAKDKTKVSVLMDSDGDGIADTFDLCPFTEFGKSVNKDGCALYQVDKDKDGVYDNFDACPNTPEGEKVDENGCSDSERDTDKDGVFDIDDNCPEEYNPKQEDKDGDGIGDVCDTENPLPELRTNQIKFVQLPKNKSSVGKVSAIDPEGESLSFSLNPNSKFVNVLDITPSGEVIVISGPLLEFKSQYNNSDLEIIIDDGTNQLKVSVRIVIEDQPRPPEIFVTLLPVKEDALPGVTVAIIEAEDPMGGEIISLTFENPTGVFEWLPTIEGDSGIVKLAAPLDFEEQESHPIIITAVGEELTGIFQDEIPVEDIPNAVYTGRFSLAVFPVQNQTLGAKVDHTRYHNPFNKSVGKWKIKKKISGGADRALFEIKTKSTEPEINQKTPQDENESYLAFINPPDFNNPQDHNKDNVYEVEVDFINSEDGAVEVPVVVTQTQIQVPEGAPVALELQSTPALPTDDTDGDGVADIIDNSPLVANPDQIDEDGDGEGDVSDDFDHDGVWNPYDVCADTPLGEVVNMEGCVLFYIPGQNFNISKTEKCAGTNQINLAVEDTSYTYKVNVTGAVNSNYSFSNSNWSLDNLSAGDYNICVTVDGVDPTMFERCFKVNIKEPSPLSVFAMANDLENKVSFNLSGGSVYNITHNGKTTQTSKSNHTLSLKRGLNRVTITTGIECQGIFEATYLNSNEVKFSPNPFNEFISIYVGGEDRDIKVEIHATDGRLIHSENCVLDNYSRTLEINTGEFKQGTYYIKVKGENTDQSFKAIKY